jgi:hypothetical protein
MDKAALLHALRASEGRILVCECIVSLQALLYNVTNAELAASQGADLLLLNRFDVDQPVIHGMPAHTAPADVIRELQRLTGRVLGANLEAVDADLASGNDELWRVSAGQAATADNARRLAEMGVRFIVLTGNPGNGVSNRALAQSLHAIRSAVGDQIILMTGKMHSAGLVDEHGDAILRPGDIAAFVEAGADVVLVPAPGTIPGMTVEVVQGLIKSIHARGAMAMTTIGTSQEGASVETIRQIALMSKMAGADLHHIGDTGYLGLAIPENILAYSIVIRGVRHTYTRIARSVNR